jgi:hypothetical protein
MASKWWIAGAGAAVIAAIYFATRSCPESATTVYFPETPDCPTPETCTECPTCDTCTSCPTCPECPAAGTDCTPGQQECSEGHLYACNNGYWVDQGEDSICPSPIVPPVTPGLRDPAIGDFAFSEVVADNLPHSCEGWAMAACPGSGAYFDYDVAQINSNPVLMGRYQVTSCYTDNQLGTHGGCSYCIMAHLVVTRIPGT